MSIYDLLDDLSKTADSVSRELHKKRCSLARDTDRDSFAQGTMEFSHLEALLKGIEAALTEIKKHIGTDTILPTSANWLEGEDINVPTTPPSAPAYKMKAVQLPAWCKVGAWVMVHGQIVQIKGVSRAPLWITCYSPIDNMVWDAYFGDLKPVRFRQYIYEEAKALFGKVMEYVDIVGSKNVTVISKITQYHNCDSIYINGLIFGSLKRCNATIDGLPIGVPEVDEEAMKEVE